jgi:hypothetical protein
MRNYIPKWSLLVVLAASFFVITAGFVITTGFVISPGRVTHAASRPAEVTRQEAIPCIFDNFVWFKDQEILDEIRKDLPSFNGSAPETGDSIKKILGALERMLKKKGLPSQVEYIFYSGGGYQYHPEHIFTARDAKVPVCKVLFQNSPPQAEGELQQAARTLVNKDYSKIITGSFIDGEVVPVYRRYGYLRAGAGVASSELDPSCKNGVVIKIAAEPGIAYLWDRAVWTGNQAMSSQSLDAAIELKPGEVANGLKIDAGLQAAYIVYGKMGYADFQMVPNPVFDDAKKRVSLNVKITEGPQFRMGNFVVKGVTDNVVQSLTERWALKPGEIFDATYPGEYVKKLIDDKIILPELAKLLNTERKLDRQKMTVDVIIEFKA